ncbi:MAG: hypothetical protein WCW33_03615 [Candidatus Babeliales bacterium]|jgi:hypothetical protein
MKLRLLIVAVMSCILVGQPTNVFGEKSLSRKTGEALDAALNYINLINTKDNTYGKNVSDVVSKWSIAYLEELSQAQLDQACRELDAAIDYHEKFRTSPEMAALRAYRTPEVTSEERAMFKKHGMTSDSGPGPIEKFVANYDEKKTKAQSLLQKIKSLQSATKATSSIPVADPGVVAPQTPVLAAGSELPVQPRTPTKEEIERYNKELKIVIESNKKANPYDLSQYSESKIKNVEKLLKKGANPNIIDTDFYCIPGYGISYPVYDQEGLSNFDHLSAWTNKESFRNGVVISIVSKEFLMVLEALLEAGGRPPLTDPTAPNNNDIWRILLSSRTPLRWSKGVSFVFHKIYEIEGRHIRYQEVPDNDYPSQILEKLDEVLKKLLRAQLAFEVGEPGFFNGNSSHIDAYIKWAKDNFDAAFASKCLNEPYPYPDSNQYPNSLYGKNVKGFTPVELAAKNEHPKCLKVMLEATGDDGKPLVTVDTAQKALQTAQFAVADITNVSSAFKKCKKLLAEFIKRDASVKSVAATTLLRQQRQQHQPIPA